MIKDIVEMADTIEFESFRNHVGMITAIGTVIIGIIYSQLQYRINLKMYKEKYPNEIILDSFLNGFTGIIFILFITGFALGKFFIALVLLSDYVETESLFEYAKILLNNFIYAGIAWFSSIWMIGGTVVISNKSITSILLFVAGRKIVYGDIEKIINHYYMVEFLILGSGQKIPIKLFGRIKKCHKLLQQLLQENKDIQN